MAVYGHWSHACGRSSAGASAERGTLLADTSAGSEFVVASVARRACATARSAACAAACCSGVPLSLGRRPRPVRHTRYAESAGVPGASAVDDDEDDDDEEEEDEEDDDDEDNEDDDDTDEAMPLSSALAILSSAMFDEGFLRLAADSSMAMAAAAAAAVATNERSRLREAAVG